jgi:NAD+ diphosphatase
MFWRPTSPDPVKVNVFGKYSVKVLIFVLSQPQSRNEDESQVTQFAYAQSPLNRLSALRTRSDEVEKRSKCSTCRYIWVHEDSVRFKDDQLDVSAPSYVADAVLLGDDAEGNSWFAVSAKPSDSLKPLRSVMVDGLLSQETLSILAQARSIVHWHQSHGFCAKCGAASVMQDAGYRRHCGVCKTDHFPRTDPVVIMAVCCGNKTLLGRQSSWPENMYSTLAGFMEPGETIEAAVRREVMEEVGIAVGRVDYVASQPWPFPSSLMIGMIGEAEDLDLTIDESEIETARWFEADELRMMLNRTHPQGLHASRPDAIAWHLAQAALVKIAGH